MGSDDLQTGYVQSQETSTELKKKSLHVYSQINESASLRLRASMHISQVLVANLTQYSLKV